MFNENEYFFSCPYCFQRVSMVLEELFGQQTYIEDCEVCCNPIEIKYSVDDSEDESKIIDFEAKRLDE